jgi:hypothetical protein
VVLYSALRVDEPHVQSLYDVLLDCQRFEAAEEECQQLAEQDYVMECNKLAEHQV